jgi:hypothetical protein
MLKLVLDDERISDAEVRLTPEGEGEVDELQLPEDTILEISALTFTPPTYEVEEAAAAAVSTVSASLPIHLAAGVTLVNAISAIAPALDSYLAGRNPSALLDVDGLAAGRRSRIYASRCSSKTRRGGASSASPTWAGSNRYGSSRSKTRALIRRSSTC